MGFRHVGNRHVPLSLLRPSQDLVFVVGSLGFIRDGRSPITEDKPSEDFLPPIITLLHRFLSLPDPFASPRSISTTRSSNSDFKRKINNLLLSHHRKPRSGHLSFFTTTRGSTYTLAYASRPRAPLNNINPLRPSSKDLQADLVEKGAGDGLQECREIIVKAD